MRLLRHAFPSVDDVRLSNGLEDYVSTSVLFFRVLLFATAAGLLYVTSTQ